MNPNFKWVDTDLGNGKLAVTGMCRSCDMRHTGRHLAGYEWRCNRRFDLDRRGGNRTTNLLQNRRHPTKQLCYTENRSRLAQFTKSGTQTCLSANNQTYWHSNR